MADPKAIEALLRAIQTSEPQYDDESGADSTTADSIASFSEQFRELEELQTRIEDLHTLLLDPSETSHERTSRAAKPAPEAVVEQPGIPTVDGPTDADLQLGRMMSYLMQSSEQHSEESDTNDDSGDTATEDDEGVTDEESGDTSIDTATAEMTEKQLLSEIQRMEDERQTLLQLIAMLENEEGGLIPPGLLGGSDDGKPDESSGDDTASAQWIQSFLSTEMATATREQPPMELPEDAEQLAVKSRALQEELVGQESSRPDSQEDLAQTLPSFDLSQSSVADSENRDQDIDDVESALHSETETDNESSVDGVIREQLLREMLFALASIRTPQVLLSCASVIRQLAQLDAQLHSDEDAVSSIASFTQDVSGGADVDALVMGMEKRVSSMHSQMPRVHESPIRVPEPKPTESEPEPEIEEVVDAPVDDSHAEVSETESDDVGKDVIMTQPDTTDGEQISEDDATAVAAGEEFMKLAVLAMTWIENFMDKTFEGNRPAVLNQDVLIGVRVCLSHLLEIPADNIGAELLVPFMDKPFDRENLFGLVSSILLQVFVLAGEEDGEEEKAAPKDEV